MAGGGCKRRRHIVVPILVMPMRCLYFFFFFPPFVAFASPFIACALWTSSLCLLVLNFSVECWVMTPLFRTSPHSLRVKRCTRARGFSLSVPFIPSSLSSAHSSRSGCFDFSFLFQALLSACALALPRRLSPCAFTVSLTFVLVWSTFFVVSPFDRREGKGKHERHFKSLLRQWLR